MSESIHHWLKKKKILTNGECTTKITDLDSVTTTKHMHKNKNNNNNNNIK